MTEKQQQSTPSEQGLSCAFALMNQAIREGGKFSIDGFRNCLNKSYGEEAGQQQPRLLKVNPTKALTVEESKSFLEKERKSCNNYVVGRS